ncbi:MAG: nuclear transport factor 2 family protein [Bacteriovoracia bacterium]
MKILFVFFFSVTTVLASNGDLEKNKKIVTEFYNLAFNQHKPQEAVKKYVGNRYTQHNPYVGDGTEPFLDYFVPFFEKNKDVNVEIKRVIAENDLVMVHVLSKKNKNDRGRAVMDIFRVENGKIVEHWDVAQEIPEKPANNNTMF